MDDRGRATEATTAPPIFEMAEPGPAFANFVSSMRDLQDLAVSAAPDEQVWEEAAQHVTTLLTLLRPYEAAEGASPAGRCPSLPGAGSLLMPPWTITEFASDGVELTVEYGRFYVGTYATVHGGVLPMLFDLVFGMAIHAAALPFSRTARMEINYRQRVPISTTVTAHGRISRTDGRKTEVTAELRDHGGSVLADSVGLLIARNAKHPEDA
jgi:acyl-coenzyme A thioesterase PaaI-like protein